MTTGRSYTIGELVARIAFKDETKAGVESAKSNVKGLRGTLENARQSLGNLHDSASAFARSMGIMGAAVTAGGLLSVKTFGDVDHAMAKLRGQVGLTQEEIDQMLPRVTEIGQSFGISLAESLEALYTITSAGQRGEVALETLAASAQGAASAYGTIKEISQLLIPTIAAYGAENISAAQALDIMAESTRLGNFEARNLAPAMQPLISLASLAGIEFHELGSAMAIMSRIQPSLRRNATSILAVLRIMIQPTHEFSDAIAEVGLNAEDLTTAMGEQGLYNTLLQIRQAFGDNEEAFIKAFSSVEALAAASLLLSGELDVARDILDSVENSTGRANASVNEFRDTVRWTTSIQLASFKDTVAEIGQEIFPIFIRGVHFIRDILSFFVEELNQGNAALKLLILAVGIGGPLMVTFAVAIKVLLIPLKLLTIAISVLNLVMSLNPIGAILLGLGLMIAALATIVIYWEQIWNFVTGIGRLIGGFFGITKDLVDTGGHTPQTGTSGTVTAPETAPLITEPSGSFSALTPLPTAFNYGAPAPTLSPDFGGSTVSNSFGDVYVSVDGSNSSPEEIAEAMEDRLSTTARAVILSNDTRIHT